MDQHGSARFTSGPVTNEKDTRLSQYTELTTGQLLAMPNGTEIAIIDLAPFGIAAQTSILLLDQEFKDGLMDPSHHDNCEHGKTHQDLLDLPVPGSFFVVLLPEDYVPDVAELLNEKFVRRGYRDGVEGAPMASATSLQTKHPDEWHDDAYNVYLAAYKRGSSSRKGR